MTYLVLALAGCGDAGNSGTQTYAPPSTPGGRMCVAQCGQSRGYCAEGCDLDYRGCYDLAQQRETRDYDAYAAQRYAAHLDNDKMPGDFVHTESCDADKKRCAADCGGAYNRCYGSCGGSLAPR